MAGGKPKKEAAAGKESPAAAEKAEGGSKDYRLWAALCYAIPILVPIIVLATDKKNDKKLQFHAWQGLILGVGWWLVSFILSFVLIGMLCWPAGWLVFLLLAYKVYTGEELEISSVSEMARKQVK